MSRLGTFTINGTEYDLDELDLDEVEKLEELVDGTPFSEINYGSAKAMKAISFILLRRTDPELAWEDVGKVKVVNFIQADEEMPTLPPEEGTKLDNGSSPEDSGTLHSVASIPG